MRVLLLLWPVCAIGCTYDFESYVPSGLAGGQGDTGTIADAGSDAPSGCTDSGAQRFEGHCYFALTTSATFESAQSSCASAGAHLVTITSAGEEAFVEAIRPGRERWIGLRRADSADPRAASSFAWITGESGTYAKWGSGEPNDSGACARLRASNDWGDQSCTTRYEAICERD